MRYKPLDKQSTQADKQHEARGKPEARAQRKGPSLEVEHESPRDHDARKRCSGNRNTCRGREHGAEGKAEQTVGADSQGHERRELGSIFRRRRRLLFRGQRGKENVKGDGDEHQHEKPEACGDGQRHVNGERKHGHYPRAKHLEGSSPSRKGSGHARPEAEERGAGRAHEHLAKNEVLEELAGRNERLGNQERRSCKAEREGCEQRGRGSAFFGERERDGEQGDKSYLPREGEHCRRSVRAGPRDRRLPHGYEQPAPNEAGQQGEPNRSGQDRLLRRILFAQVAFFASRHQITCPHLPFSTK